MEDDKALRRCHDDDDEHFGSWLSGVSAQYKSFSDADKNAVLQDLIANSQSNQMEFLNEHLPPLVCKDPISQLSLEHVTIILKCLSGKDVLRCCQVSKRWRERIDSLTEFWKTKAFETGVNVEAISQRYSDWEGVEMAKVYKTCYCLAADLLHNWQRNGAPVEDSDRLFMFDDDLGTRIYFTDDHVLIGNCSARQVEIYSAPDLSLKHTLDARFSLLGCYKYSLVFTHDYDGHAYSWNVQTHSDTDIFDIYTSESDAENENENNTQRREDRSLHKFSSPDYQTIWAIDVTRIGDETFVVTGGDGALKVWQMHPSRKECELLMTLDEAHTRNREMCMHSAIHFLPTAEDGKLRFISIGLSKVVVWAVDVKVKSQERSCIINGDVNSCHFQTSKPEDIFIAHWNKESDRSMLTFHRVSSSCKKTTAVGFEQMDQWNLTKRGLRSPQILGVGSRFAFFMCKRDLQTFQLFDLKARCIMVTFSGARRFDRLPVRLYNYRAPWLEGFEFEENYMESPNVVGMVTQQQGGRLCLDMPRLEDYLYDDDYDDDDGDVDYDNNVSTRQRCKLD